MTREEAIADGNKYYCLGCHTCYVHIPQVIDDFCQGGAQKMDMCKCDSDLFARLSDNSPASSDGRM